MFKHSRLQEIMRGLPKAAFMQIVASHNANKHSKGFGCWEQLLAMVYAQLSGLNSLRTVAISFNAHKAHHYHLAAKALRRSTLADANAKRSPEVFAQTAKLLMAQAQRVVRRNSGQFLRLIDSTSIFLHAAAYDKWTSDNRTRNTKGLKLHVIYDADKQLPVLTQITPPNINDISFATTIKLEAGATYVFDKAYCDYNWWSSFDEQGSFFVTRFKRTAALRLESQYPVSPDEKMILEDCRVSFSNRNPRGGKRNTYQRPLRRITVARPLHPTPLVLATNDFNSNPKTIASYYKTRWQIELYFKWIKQHLKIKTFMGHSANAVKTQIFCALISYLLLSIYHARHKMQCSLWGMLALSRVSLFQRVEIDNYLYRQQKFKLCENNRQASLFK